LKHFAGVAAVRSLRLLPIGHPMHSGGSKALPKMGAVFSCPG
jgi:hypothetical protein